jgi:hypothetical protein
MKKFLCFVSIFAIYAVPAVAEEVAAQTPQASPAPVVQVSSPAPSDSLKITPYIRMRSTSNFTNRQTVMDMDSSGIIFEKKVGDNFTAVFVPEFNRRSSVSPLTSTTTTNYTNDTLDAYINELYLEVKDISRSYGDYGISLKLGQYEAPFYRLEQSYQPFRFIYKPLEDKLLTNGRLDLGLMLGKSLFDDSLKIYLSYITGASKNGELFPSTNNDSINAGASRFMINFSPFKTMGNAALKDLSLTFNLKAYGRVNAKSYYNFLLGYKYDRFAASLEYLKTYSTDIAKFLSAVSFSTSYDIYGPFQGLFRWDYSDTGTKRTADHLIVAGVNTKWLEGKWQVAFTFDNERNPSTSTTIANRFMISSQYKY